MNTPRNRWQRLVAAARRSPADDGDAAAPYGFSTRVVALAFATERKPNSVVERLALRALGLAILLAVVGVVANYSVWSTNPAPTEASYFTLDDPATILFDGSS